MAGPHRRSPPRWPGGLRRCLGGRHGRPGAHPCHHERPGLRPHRSCRHRDGAPGQSGGAGYPADRCLRYFLVADPRAGPHGSAPGLCQPALCAGGRHGRRTGPPCLQARADPGGIAGAGAASPVPAAVAAVPVAGSCRGGICPVAAGHDPAPRRLYRRWRRGAGGTARSCPAGCHCAVCSNPGANYQWPGAMTILLALLLDALLGEPRRWHPLVGFGRLVTRLESLLRHETHRATRQQLAGLLGWLVLALLPALLLWQLLSSLDNPLLIAVEVLVLYLCIGNRSLAEHARAVARPLLAGDLDAARRAVAMIVSRDTAALDASGATRATVESVLENGSDAVLAPLFWFAL